MTTFSTILIGEGSLLVRCAEMLRARGHEIRAIVAEAVEITDWASAAGVPVYAPDGELVRDLAPLGADWLLSIANLRPLSPEILAVAKRGAINFHDGPLPAMAGLNTPVWAILEGRDKHAITWHLMTDTIDGGDILETRSVAIDDEETALTLNAKCYGAALDAFAPLLDQLEGGRLRSLPQAQGTGRLYRRDDRPPADGRIDFTRPAEDGARLVRALDHGSYPNPMCRAKIEAGGRILVVDQAEVTQARGAPGRVIAVEGREIEVACREGGLRLRLAEAPPPLRAGDVLPSADTAHADRIAAALSAAVRRDGPWRARLAAMIRPELPLAHEVRAAAAEDAVGRHPLGVAVTKLGEGGAALARLCGQSRLDIALGCDDSAAPGYLSDWVPVCFDGEGRSRAAAVTEFEAVAKAAGMNAPFARDLLHRDPRIAPTSPAVALTRMDRPVEGALMTLALGAEAAVYFDPSLPPTAQAILLARLAMVLAEQTDESALFRPEFDLPPDELELLLHGFNDTATVFDATPLHRQFEAQVRRAPDAVAAIFGTEQITRADLDTRANRIAHLLRDSGVAAGDVVGLHLPRGFDMLAAVLGVMKAGAAYLPLDPGFPNARLRHYVTDSGAGVILSHRALAADLEAEAARTILLDDTAVLADRPVDDPGGAHDPDALAYLIYTSGSTGTPKGVRVTHRNLSNFLAAMDAHVTHDQDSCWLAVTSLSFDISVLELFYTLARGIRVVIAESDARLLAAAEATAVPEPRPGGECAFSLFYWGNDDGDGAEKYRLLLEGARFADAHGFCAVWTPERHFHAFGGPYPNPSVTGAAVAAVTRNIAVRAGSCVAPLHHPARIAEEWAVIDNLTDGRAGLALASGWQPDDFVLRPENTPPANKPALLQSISVLRRLWSGEAVEFARANGKMQAVVTQPRPVSKELPIWVTTAGNPATWVEAGEIGANVLTHLLGQSIEEVGEKIAIYHEALRRAGHDPARFTVTLMLHSYLAENRERAREVARGPMKDYLRSAAALIKQYAWAFPAFKRPEGAKGAFDLDLGGLEPEELESILDFAFERYFTDSGLFGTVEDALAQVRRLRAIGIGEIACLIDYGIAPDLVLEGLKPLAEVLRRSGGGAGAGKTAPRESAFAAQIRRHRVTHLQCTPSMARMLLMDGAASDALGGLRQVFLGGEALPGALVRELRARTPARIDNMYGPTETTIWSSRGSATGQEAVESIGRPLANTVMRVVDEAGALAAIGQPGELLIGGAGVTAGYHDRETLNRERFIDDPWSQGGRLYRTGDLARWQSDGSLAFLGRADGQVKLRGFRIELGEIEAALDSVPGVAQCVVTLREDRTGDPRLAAYLRGAEIPTDAALRKALSAQLPDYMVPAHFTVLDAFPMTPNGKLDRAALPAPTPRVDRAESSPEEPRRPATRAAAPARTSAALEAEIASVWCEVLGLSEVRQGDNFFDLGGHSLLAVQLHRALRDRLGLAELGITDVFRFPVLSALVRRAVEIGGAAPGQASDAARSEAPATARALSRREAMARRRDMRRARAEQGR